MDPYYYFTEADDEAQGDEEVCGEALVAYTRVIYMNAMHLDMLPDISEDFGGRYFYHIAGVVDDVAKPIVAVMGVVARHLGTDEEHLVDMALDAIEYIGRALV